jgi:hypothetical protein
MLKRWDTRIADLNNFVETLEELCPEILEAKRPGRPPKRSLKEYLTLITIKEEAKTSLRRAETEYSTKICGERVDHSVIHYWEKKLDEVATSLVRRIGQALLPLVTLLFCIIDSTKFATWKNEEIEFHTQVAVTEETVFPLTMFFGSVSPKIAVENTVLQGNGDFMADRWYDANDAIGVLFKRGYKPIVKPIEERYRGYWRRKARKIFGLEWFKYRDRGRGESPYGSLTNAYGDRLKTTLTETTKTRIAVRAVSYLTKLYIRAKIYLELLDTLFA